MYIPENDSFMDLCNIKRINTFLKQYTNRKCDNSLTMPQRREVKTKITNKHFHPVRSVRTTQEGQLGIDPICDRR